MSILIFILLYTLMIIMLHKYHKSKNIKSPKVPLANNVFCNGIMHNDLIIEWLNILNIGNNIKLLINNFKIDLKNNIKIKILLSLKEIILTLDNLSKNLNNFLEKVKNIESKNFCSNEIRIKFINKIELFNLKTSLLIINLTDFFIFIYNINQYNTNNSFQEDEKKEIINFMNKIIF
jgi:hypothetical protein